MDREGRPLFVGKGEAEERREDVRRRQQGKTKVQSCGRWFVYTYVYTEIWAAVCQHPPSLDPTYPTPIHPPTRQTNERWGGGADALSLEELVRREKLGGEDMDREFARNVVRMGKHFKGAELGTGCVVVCLLWLNVFGVGWRIFFKIYLNIYMTRTPDVCDESRDQAGMDEEDYIDTRMFEKREDRLTDKVCR